MTQTAVPSKGQAAATGIKGSDAVGKRGGKPLHIRAQIIEYLARNGASRLSDISSDVAACRDTIRSHLLALEKAAIVRSNIPAGTRARTTPFYSLASRAGAGAAASAQDSPVILTVHITQAADGQLTLAVDELPGLTAYARSFGDIPSSVRAAASLWTGKASEAFTVQVRL